MIAIFDGDVWGCGENPFASLKPGTLVIALDPTRGGGGPDGPIKCYLVGRVTETEDGPNKVSEWRQV